MVTSLHNHCWVQEWKKMKIGQHLPKSDCTASDEQWCRQNVHNQNEITFQNVRRLNLRGTFRPNSLSTPLESCPCRTRQPVCSVDTVWSTDIRGVPTLRYTSRTRIQYSGLYCGGGGSLVKLGGLMRTLHLEIRTSLTDILRAVSVRRMIVNRRDV